MSLSHTIESVGEGPGSGLALCGAPFQRALMADDAASLADLLQESPGAGSRMLFLLEEPTAAVPPSWVDGDAWDGWRSWDGAKRFGDLMRMAAASGAERCVEALIDWGFDPEGLALPDHAPRERSLWSPPLLLASHWGKPRMLGALLGAGADIKKSPGQALRCLVWAAMAGDRQCVEMLLGAGADASDVTGEGVNSLIYAMVPETYGDSKGVVEALLLSGASPVLPCSNGRSAIEFARECQRDDLADFMSSWWAARVEREDLAQGTPLALGAHRRSARAL